MLNTELLLFWFTAKRPILKLLPKSRTVLINFKHEHGLQGLSRGELNPFVA